MSHVTDRSYREHTFSPDNPHHRNISQFQEPHSPHHHMDRCNCTTSRNPKVFHPPTRTPFLSPDHFLRSKRGQTSDCSQSLFRLQSEGKPELSSYPGNPGWSRTSSLTSSRSCRNSFG